MLRINRRIVIPDDEIQLRFTRSSGPGGQNVNKVETAVQLRFHVTGSPSLPEDVRERLFKSARNRINNRGELVIDARRFRSQERNREDAMERLRGLLEAAAVAPKPRKKTRPSPAAKAQRMDAKRRQGATKRRRAKPSLED